MLGAIFVGLSGMQAFSKGLKTISTNVANLDTLGYKSSTVSFSDMFGEHANGLAYTSGQAGSSTGNGVHFNKEQIDFGQGSFQQTGNGLDLAMDGNGFLVVKTEGGEIFYTRTGQFSVDDKGFISTQSGNRLTILDAQGKPVEVNTKEHLTNLPKETKKIEMTGTIASATTDAIKSANIEVYDTSGAKYTWRVDVKTVTSDDPLKVKWEVKVYQVDTANAANDVQIGETKTILFDKATALPDGTANTVTISATPTGGIPMSVTVDFSKVRSPATANNDFQKLSSDGHPAGVLNTVSVNEKGELVMNYSNTQKDVLGFVAVADFQNLQDLTRVGNGLFTDNGNSQLQYKASGRDGIGKLLTGQVEASNVDLTAEFGNLILIQRGFDASSQVISATNDMIQALFGMRGRG